MSVLYLWFYNKMTFRKMAVRGVISWAWGWAMLSRQEQGVTEQRCRLGVTKLESIPRRHWMRSG